MTEINQDDFPVMPVNLRRNPDMYKALSAEEVVATADKQVIVAKPSENNWRPILPVPAGVPAEFPHHRNGKPSASWRYYNENGQLLAAVARFDIPGGKEVLPMTYCEHTDGRREWRWTAMPAPRALYGLRNVTAYPAYPILVVEGEKAADAAQSQFPDFVVITSSSGSKAAEKTDWSPLAGRDVTIWPDNDKTGRDYASDVAALAIAAGATNVRVVDVPADFPEKWDLADQPPEAWTVEHLRDLLDGAQQEPATTETPKHFRVEPDGVYRLVEREDKSSGEVDKEWVWFCSPLEVIAETRDVDGENWGRLLVLTDNDGGRHEWALPMELLAGSGEEYRKHLLSLGLIISPGKPARDALHQYLSTARPALRARCVSRIGWHGKSYVLPDETFGATQGERVLLQTVRTPDHAFRTARTLLDWQQNVARYAVGNSRLAFSISTAFAAPLIALCDAESGGFHFRGPSSIGKSTAMLVAGSVWGGGTLKGYVRQWRATDNGLEAVAQMHCDSLLCLDEMSQVDAKSVGAAAYMLANGAGKSRAGRGGEGRNPAEWRTLFLSNGEIGLADKLAEDGRHRKVAAGQQVRVIDMAADTGGGLGMFETIHGFDNADAFARQLKQAASEQYGTAARAFLDELTRNPDEVRISVTGHKNDFVTEHCPDGADGQVMRVADRFGLVAAAGELATALGILHWERGEASRAAAICFREWLTGRGGLEPAEVTEGISQVRRYIEQHGESRFAPWRGIGDNRPTVDRAGFRRANAGDEIEYYVLPEAWRSEVCAGFDPGMIARALMERGLLISDNDGKPQSRHRLPGSKGPVRCYRLAAGILGNDDD